MGDSATDGDDISALARACRPLHVSGRGGGCCFYVVIHLCAVPTDGRRPVVVTSRVRFGASFSHSIIYVKSRK
ncbi:hypothetical protein CBL_04038, partial [Carabus blaptoides fortunei]